MIGVVYIASFPFYIPASVQHTMLYAVGDLPHGGGGGGGGELIIIVLVCQLPSSSIDKAVYTLKPHKPQQ